MARVSCRARRSPGQESLILPPGEEGEAVAGEGSRSARRAAAREHARVHQHGPFRGWEAFARASPDLRGAGTGPRCLMAKPGGPEGEPPNAALDQDKYDAEENVKIICLGDSAVGKS
ncbi:hypothetical protein E2320_004436, partial [Naja naja]